VTAGLAVGTIALLMLGLQPILLGELVNAGRVTLESVGLFATAGIIALGLGVVAGGPSGAAACIGKPRCRPGVMAGSARDQA